MGAGAAGSNNPMSKFSWGIVGNVIIRTLKYSGEIDQFSQKKTLKLPKNRVTESKLSWVNREFTLEDLRTIDFDDGRIVDFPSLQARFRVTLNDEFECLIDTEELVNCYQTSFNKTLTADHQQMLIQKVTNQCKNLWDSSRFLWVKHRNLLAKKAIKHCGCNCYELTLNKDAEKADLESFIKKKYQPDKIGEVSRKLRAKLIIDRNSTRPHLIFVRRSNYAEIVKNTEIKSEVKEEMFLLIYCWDEVPQLASENFIKSEIRKINEVIKFQEKDFNQTDKYRLKSKVL